MGSKSRKKTQRTSLPKETTSDSVPTVRIPITDTLDLHAFSPKELEPLLEDYLEACQKQGIKEVRIIHGKGTGVQRRRVQSFLSKTPAIQSFRDADPGGGGWGATIVTLRKADHHPGND